MSRTAASMYFGSTMGLIAGRGPAAPPRGIQVRPVCPTCSVRLFAATPREQSRAAESDLEKTRRFTMIDSISGKCAVTSSIAYGETTPMSEAVPVRPGDTGSRICQLGHEPTRPEATRRFIARDAQAIAVYYCDRA